MAEEFGQAMATAEMTEEEAKEAAQTAAAEAQAAEAPAQEKAAEKERAVGYDVDLDYNMEWEVETEPAEPDVIVNAPRDAYDDEYYDERMRRARRMYNKHLFVWVFNFVCGLYGVDRFVRGQTAIGVLKCLTFGGLGIWYLVDLIIALVKCYSGEYMYDENVYFDILGHYI